MSLNDGGPVVRVSKEPVEKPFIPRGEILGPVQQEGDGVTIGSMVTFTWPAFAFDGARFAATYHAATVIGQVSDKCAGQYLWLVAVSPDTVVTWDRL